MCVGGACALLTMVSIEIEQKILILRIKDDKKNQA